MEENSGLAVEMSKRLLKKPDATVDAVLKVNRSILLLKRSYLQKFSVYFKVRGCYVFHQLLEFTNESIYTSQNSAMRQFTPAREFF